MKDLLKDFDIGIADIEDCLEILAEPQLLAALHLTSPDELPNHLATSNRVYYTIEYGKYKLVFCWFKVAPYLYEAHIACPKASIVASRLLTLAALVWVFRLQSIDVRGIITSCPRGKMANMIRKIGGKLLSKDYDFLYFMFTRNQLNNSLKD